MELRQLRTFRAVATAASFTQAAVILNYAQSSVTAQIQALEQEMGVPLFDRLGRRVRLTEAGMRLLQYAGRILDLVDEAQASVSGSAPLEGVISIGAPETICTYRLPAVLRAFRDAYPQVRLSFRPMLDADLFHAVRSGAVDIGFLLQEPVKAEGLVVEGLILEPLLVLAGADHPLAREPAVGPADLSGQTLLLTENGCGYRHLFEQAVAQAGVYSVIKLEFNSVEAIKQCVAAGLGIAFLPRVAVSQELAQGRLCALPWGKSFQVTTQLIYNKEKWLSPALNGFLALSRSMLCRPGTRGSPGSGPIG